MGDFSGEAVDRAAASSFVARYEGALTGFLRGGAAVEETRLACRALGREALAAGIGVLEIAASHAGALARSIVGANEPGAVVLRAAEFLNEVLSPIEEALRRVREATAQLAALSAELDVTRRQAEDESRHKSTFLATMSHEIRTPMNAVIGMTTLLLDGELNGDQRELAEAIRTSGSHLLGVINDILDFSKVQAGEVVLEAIPFELIHWAEESLDLLPLKTMRREVDLVLDVAAEAPCPLIGDPGRLRQVLLNLVGNALKFTACGEVAVSLSVEVIDAERVRLRGAVRDTGVGISPEGLARLFRPFSQAEATTSRVFGGTGLGLAISKQLCERMGGDIEVRSAVGEGTEFRFHVEMAREPAVARGGPPRALQGVRALVVDDRESARAALARLLRAWGLDVVEATSAAQARALAERGTALDVALVDHVLGDGDGAALCRELWDLWPDVARILLTTDRSVDLTALGERALGVALYKPVKRAALQLALSNRDARDASGARRPPVSQFQTMAEARPLQILVVEDNPFNLTVIVRMLAKLGYRVDIARDGGEGVAAVGRRRYDVVLMDMHMPVMDGLEAVAAIRRRHPEGDRPYIIALTAAALPEERQRCIDVGMDDYLSKPIMVDSLIASLSRVSARG